MTSPTSLSSEQNSIQPPNNNNNNNNKDESLRTLELAMKAADAIRKSLQQMEDPHEQGLWIPPGTMPGVAAFVATGLLFSPLRSAILKRAGASSSTAAAAQRQSAAMMMVKKPNNSNHSASTSPSSSSPPPPPPPPNIGLGTFQNLMDLIVTPAMAVIAAQVGLVVGTLYGSSHYLQRVMEVHDRDTGRPELYHESMVEKNGDRKRIDLCQSLLSLTSSSSSSSSQSSTTTDSIHIMAHDGPVVNSFSSVQGESFDMETNKETPNLYPSWDPRQNTIGSLYRAIRHCQQQQNDTGAAG
jgi:hypothetical protein